jgi:peptidoglycan/xylan/chitin deacetylase (PgdA/CDA1 family)
MKKLIALTFDDGPGEYTERLLDILSQYNAKATFFVLGNCIDNKESILERMIN